MEPKKGSSSTVQKFEAKMAMATMETMETSQSATTLP
jgi:hypothetical protein